MLDPRAKRFLDMLAAVAGAPPGAIAERRTAFRGLLRQAGSRRPAEAKVRDLEIEGAAGLMPARLYGPVDRGGETLPGLLFCHGGGLVAGDLDSHDTVCRGIGAAGRLRVLAFAYRLAPEHPFPAALDDAVAALGWATRHAGELNIDPKRLAVGGDSAGAGLAASLCQEAHCNGPSITAQLLLCPVLDASGDLSSRRDFAEGYFLDSTAIASDVAAYAGAADPADPRISPLRAADFAGLPPAIIHTAEYDPVRDDGAAYAERLERAGVPVGYRCHPGMIHLFYALAGVMPQGDAALAAIGAELRAMMDGDDLGHG